jgi:hypothetical protein
MCTLKSDQLSAVSAQLFVIARRTLTVECRTACFKVSRFGYSWHAHPAGNLTSTRQIPAVMAQAAPRRWSSIRKTGLADR